MTDTPTQASPCGDREAPFGLTVTTDALRVLFSGLWPVEDDSAMQAALEAELAHHGIPQRLPVEVLERLREAARDGGSSIKGFCLLEGQAPGESVDGFIEWARDFFDAAFVVEESTGQIDYRKRRAQLSLGAGEAIARIVPGLRGEDGVDVYGKAIAARKPRTPRIAAGRGVIKDDTDETFLAAVDGRFRWNGQRLAVDPVHTVEGDVGLDSGDIDHPGAVIITGDVQEGATVRATGDIEVMGVLEAATVETTGSLMVRRGIIGRGGKHPIRAGGDVFAKFIIEGNVRARGSVSIEREVVNSAIWAGGAVHAPAGRAFGGRIVAHGGMVVKTLGSEGLVSTELVVGEDPFLEETLAPQEEAYEITRTRLEDLNARLKPLVGHMERLSVEKKRGMAHLLQTVRTLGEECERLKEEIQQIKEESNAAARYRVRVREQVHAEVVIHMRGETYRLHDELLGPLLIALERDGIRLSAP